MQTDPPSIHHPLTGDPRVGLRRAQAQVSIVAAATSTTLYQLTTGRTGFVRKLLIVNRGAASAEVGIGETVAAAWTQRLGPYQVPGNSHEVFPETEIPSFEFTSDVIGRSSAAGADPDDVIVTLEVEERLV